MISIIHPPTEMPEFVSAISNGRRYSRLPGLSVVINGRTTTSSNDYNNKFSKKLKTKK